MPPGFMKATTASPKSVGEVDASCASAITSPSADSPAALFVFVMSADCEPTTRLAIGPERASYLLMIAVSAASLATSRVTITLCAVALTMSFVCWSMRRSMSVISRPNEDALVTSFPLIRQMYG